jgi:hypothetical protein
MMSGQGLDWRPGKAHRVSTLDSPDGVRRQREILARRVASALDCLRDARAKPWWRRRLLHHTAIAHDILEGRFDHLIPPEQPVSAEAYA